ncbi:interleukin-33 isoform X1 [Erinaceus europaeus]|uniref:Interleukin-33 n=1 Tax=Erinaceus europaeus TaxID=9365 RepID=A0ABM3Y2K2_ERIEU|nr:interleukin-33 isoform X1 [Erinaceus europaeus]XP_060055285.1 interleukin-33 isoform X1 [Erinaceus europaeus]
MKSKSTKVPQSKMNNSAVKTPQFPNVKASKQKPEKVHQMHLRSRPAVKNQHCFRKEITKIYSSKTVEKSVLKDKSSVKYYKDVVPRLANATDMPIIREFCASLSTYKDESITFICEEEGSEIFVEELPKDQEKDKVLLDFHLAQSSSNETGDNVNSPGLMVSMSPRKGKDLWLQANNEEQTVELQKCEKSLPDKAYFLLHWYTAETVRFECKSNPGVFIGVKDNQLALIQVGNQTEGQNRESTLFKLSMNIMESYAS